MKAHKALFSLCGLALSALACVDEEESFRAGDVHEAVHVYQDRSGGVRFMDPHTGIDIDDAEILVTTPFTVSTEPNLHVLIDGTDVSGSCSKTGPIDVQATDASLRCSCQDPSTGVMWSEYCPDVGCYDCCNGVGGKWIFRTKNPWWP